MSTIARLALAWWMPQTLALQKWHPFQECSSLWGSAQSYPATGLETLSESKQFSKHWSNLSLEGYCSEIMLLASIEVREALETLSAPNAFQGWQPNPSLAP